jgi:hypothetical protein
MAFDERLAERVRALLIDEPDELREQRMFGGLAFLLRGNMAVGIYGDGLLVRMAPEEHDALLRRAHVHVFDMGGRPMRGWAVVDAEGLRTKRQLQSWVERGRTYAASLPPK